MATMRSVTSADDYYKKYLESAKANVNSAYDTKKEGTEKSIREFNETTDAAAQKTAGNYQEQIDTADKTFREEYDKNELNRLVEQKKLQESMANAGLTDSGLNRSQMTALSVMKGKADSRTDKQKRDYVTELQKAIDTVLADAEASKANYANNLRKNDEDWYASALLEADNSARKSAADSYNADYESAYKQYVADIEAEQKAIDNQNKYNQDILKTIISKNGGNYIDAVAQMSGTGKYSEKYANDYNNAVSAGKSDAYATAYAEALSEGYDEETAEDFGSMEDAKAFYNANYVSKKFNGFWNNVNLTLWKGGRYNSAYVVEDVQRDLAKDDDYNALDSKTRKNVEAIVVGNQIRKIWGDEYDAQFGTFGKKLIIGLQDKYGTGTAEYNKVMEESGLEKWAENNDVEWEEKIK